MQIKPAKGCEIKTERLRIGANQIARLFGSIDVQVALSQPTHIMRMIANPPQHNTRICEIMGFRSRSYLRKVSRVKG